MHTNKFWKRAQSGLTLLEVMISLTIISASMLGLNAIAERYSADTKLTLTANQERTFGEAAKAYIKDNYAAVQAASTATAPALIDVPTLIASGNLPTGFLVANAYGQSLCALVLQPTANRLQAMVVSENGQVIDDLSLGSLAAIVGGSGGGVYASDPATIRGAIGGWSITTATFDNRTNNVNRRCDGTAGKVLLAAGHPVMALWFENGDVSSAFLARDLVPGRPELNQMNTPVVMNSVQTTNAACTLLGAIARNAAGAVLSCQGGLWTPQGSAFWQDAVATYAALPACAAASSGQTRIVTAPTVGTGPRAYTCNGTSWTALAVDDSGNLTLPGILTTGKVQVNDVVTEGSSVGCTQSGLVAKDSTGLLLSCQSGVWTGVEKALQFGGEATPIDCPGNTWTDISQSACQWPHQQYIAFPSEFESPPVIQVTPISMWTDYTTCMAKLLGPSGYYESGWGTDALLAFAERVTTKGFYLRGASSMENGAAGCGINVYWHWTPIVVRWVANGKKKQ